MSKQILCAVRGGRESRDTVSLAIDLALEQDAALTFVHVLDAEFLQYATIGPPSIVYRELAEMGRFTMLILVDRAQRRGVKEVHYDVRHGNIRKQLRQAAEETEATVLVMGRPTRSPTSNVFASKELDKFSELLAKAGDLSVVFSAPEAGEAT
ncbi:MAG: universal stress protein [Candidatus Promineifilaceae bacterium]|nr:universal stress protein [Candidatus Promineifilaceae bacterium]